MASPAGGRFKSYGDHLTFEGMNEVMVNYNTPLQPYHDQINARPGHGGNNAARGLVVPGQHRLDDRRIPETHGQCSGSRESDRL